MTKNRNRTKPHANHEIARLNRKRVFLSCYAILGALTPVAARAQVEEIIVTARKRAENIQQTPIAITAFKAEDLEARNVRDISDIASFTPSLHQTPGFAGGNNNVHFFMRGIGQVDNIPTYDPRVALYLDGVYIARSVGNLLDTSGIEQIEISRGPQGTLFGRNSVGGAISVSTRRPTGDTNGRLEVTTGRFERIDGKLDAEFPIIADSLAASVNLVTLNGSGFGKGLTDGTEFGNRNALSGRLAINAYGSDDFSFYATLDGTRRRENTRPVHLEQLYPIAPTSPLLTYLRLVENNKPFNAALIAPSKFDSFTTGDSRNDMDLYGVSGIATWTLGEVNLKSTTAYRNQDTTFGVDQDTTAFKLLDQTRFVKQNQLTQELQLTGGGFDDRLDWVLGGFFMRENSKTEFDRQFQVGLFAATRTTDFENVTVTLQKTTNWAGYTHLSFDLTDQLSLSGGTRISYEEKKADQLSYLKNRQISIYRGPGNAVLPAGAVITATNSWTSWTPKASIDFKANENALLYVSYSKGFTSGGFDGRPINNIGVPNAFLPETLNSYEAGFKLDLFDRTLRFNGAAYTADYKNLQVTNNRVDPVTAVPVSVTINAGKAKIDGFEFEAIAAPNANLEFSGSLSYTNNRFKEVPVGNPFPVTDRPPNVPKWTAAAGAQYRFDMANGATLTTRLDLSHQGKYYNEIANGGVFFGSTTRTEFVSAENGYVLLNARITYETEDKLWKLSAFGTNLTDERYRVAGFTNAAFGYTLAYYGTPAEWGITLGRAF
ncbi:MAG: TonB-dependent receptor [Rhodospirillaceae bacterium]|nr:TonB-dependent receptor [Rhodospirillaceae bacterium]